MFKKKDKKEFQEKAKLTESNKYKSMNKEEIIRKLIEKEKLFQDAEEDLSESRKIAQEENDLSQ